LIIFIKPDISESCPPELVERRRVIPIDLNEQTRIITNSLIICD